MSFQVGDIVTRDGSDLQRIISATDDVVEVECVRPPRSRWCRVGERETNMAARYSYPADLLIDQLGSSNPTPSVEPPQEIRDK
jgi:hypothetical protein